MDLLVVLAAVAVIGIGVAASFMIFIHARRSRRYKAALQGRRSIKLTRS